MTSIFELEANKINDYKKVLKERVYTKVCDLTVEAWKTQEPVSFEEKETGEYHKLNLSDSWGKLWDCAWMHITGSVPESAKGKKLVIRIDLSGEACVFDAQGNPVRGLTTYASVFDRSLGMPAKRVLQLTPCSNGNEVVDLWLDAGCNDLFGYYAETGKLSMAEISICDEKSRELYYDYAFLAMLESTLPEHSPHKLQLHKCLIDVASKGNQLTEEMMHSAKEMLKPFLEKHGDDGEMTLSAIGHAHIDLAWLWPIRETIRKGVRTFSTALELMDRYPDYIFGASQPQMYQWMKDRYPDLYRRIREKISEGRWEAQGSMWVEADTNVSGGEALVRQMLYGKNFFQEEFGKDMKVLWLPDVFGYSAALPQIMKKSGVDYFMTIKLSWSMFNEFPHHTFIWKGMDGTEVLAHMPPEGEYNSGATPISLRKIEKKFKDKEVCDEAMLLFGIGDGGGGPGSDHLEWLSREKDMAGLPKVKQEHSIEFFERLNQNREKYATWQGELYLEKHQGTYTTQAQNKKYNRLMELILRETEYLCSIAERKCGMEYPQEKLEIIWKEVLLYQFHDILPGSSIQRVYIESQERYAQMYKEVMEIRDKAVQIIADHYATNGEHIYVNTLSFPRITYIEKDSTWLKAELQPFEIVEEAKMQAIPYESDTIVKDLILENKWIKVKFMEDGQIASIWDKEEEREVLGKQAVQNNLLVYVDDGDAWDFSYIYMNQTPEAPKVVETKVVQKGISSALEIHYEYGKSNMIQTITLGEDKKALRFDMKVEWQETNRMLRAKYPVEIVTDHANCQIQFGHIERPTHQNTSWDAAKFEVCAHKWLDLSEKGYGVALINDCKYGFRIVDNVLDINLLRSPMYPGENADKGTHEFSYELFIHNGDLVKVNAEAECFNTDVICMKSNGNNVKDLLQPVIQKVEQNVVVEAMKKAEKSDGYIIRLYECEGKNTRTSVTIPEAKQVFLTNLMEMEEAKLAMDASTVTIKLKPFEIITLKVLYELN